MITLDCDTRLEKVQDAPLVTKTEAAARLVAASISTTTPWLASALSALRELQARGRVEPGVGDMRISTETADAVGQVLGSIRLRWLPIPDVTVVSGGGIVLRWSVADQEVEVAVLARDRVLLTTLEGGEISESRPLRSSEYLRLNDVLRSLVGPS